MESKLKAVVIGATGATGRLLVDYLLSSKQWSTVAIITRRKLDLWDSLPMTDCDIKFILVKDLDILAESKDKMIENNKDLNFEGYSSVFNCLGSRVGRGEEEFRKVDYTYVVNSASLCEKFNIPHFSHISSQGTNSKSCLLYMRVKGELEEKLQTMKINKLSIFKPGAILNRSDERCGEKVLKVLIYLTCCLLPHIQCKDLAMAVGHEAEKASSVGFFSKLYSNSEIKSLSKDGDKKKI